MKGVFQFVLICFVGFGSPCISNVAEMGWTGREMSQKGGDLLVDSGATWKDSAHFQQPPPCSFSQGERTIWTQT